jgi:RNA polymerase sigma-70 factor (ECF subfamily)
MTTPEPDGIDLELALARAAAQGSAPAAEALYLRHHQRVYACCVRLTGDPDTAADLTQEVFLRMLREVASFRGEARFSTWLLRIARNVSIDWRRAAQSQARGEAAMARQMTLPDRDPSAPLTRTDLLERALARLRPESREALVLARYHDLPHAELALVLDCSVAAARVRVHRAIRELREIVLALEGATP